MPSKRLGVLAMYLTGKRLEELSYFRKLSKVGHKLGLEVAVFTPTDLHRDREHVQALFYDVVQRRWVRRWIPFPSLIYDRCRYHGKDNFLMLQKFRSSFHSKLNLLARPLANKFTMHGVLANHPHIRPHLPDTASYNGVKDLLRMLKKHNIVFLKPKNGTGGRGIVRIEYTGNGNYVLRGRNKERVILPPLRASASELQDKLKLWNVDHKYLIQQGIRVMLDDGRVCDFRLLVQKNGFGEWEVTGCAGRIGPYRSVTSNLHGGGMAISMEKLLLKQLGGEADILKTKDEVYALGLDIAAHLESNYGSLCELGIDIAVDPKGGVWLIEVNPKPSREVFARIGEKETYRNAITRPLEYALWVLDGKKQDENLLLKASWVTKSSEPEDP